MAQQKDTRDIQSIYLDYRYALQLLAASHTTVAQRKLAIIERDTFEQALRVGQFNAVFGYTD